MKVLITGFDPFGGESINPAWEAVKGIKENIGDIEVVKLQIPTVFKKSSEIFIYPREFSKFPVWPKPE